MMRNVAVVPARYQSSRMPGKPIADIMGKPMIWWVYSKCLDSHKFDKVVVATDDERIYSKCQELSMEVLMTSDKHDTPTSRLYEVSQRIEADLYYLIMGDEPLINIDCFDLIIPNTYDGDYYVAALTNVLKDPADVIDFSNQKVVTDKSGNALFISRSPIPYPKGLLDITYVKVTGVQVFSKKALDFYNATKRSNLEKAEENDLMRFIENGIKVKMIQSDYKTISVDTPKDLDLVRKIIRGDKSDTE